MDDSAALLRMLEATGQVAHTLTVPARPARFAAWPAWVHPRVRAAVEGAGVITPWEHQAQAADLLHGGTHTVLATGTGSGKSLAAWVPALSELAYSSEASRDGRGLSQHSRTPITLYLSPTKALAADQLASLRPLLARTGLPLVAAQCDGDADSAEKAWARQHGDILLTNPDYVHYAMLARPERFNRVFAGLRFVIVDEFHSYRGMFAANVALIMRRLLRLAARSGAHPTVAFLSATSAEPLQAAQRFLGPTFGPVACVAEDASPQGTRTIALWKARPLTHGQSRELFRAAEKIAHASNERPARHDAARTQATHEAEAQAGALEREDAATATLDALLKDGAGRRSATTEAGELTGMLAARGMRTLTFVRSRGAAESVATIAQKYLATHAPELSEAVMAYRGGYLPEERRALEGRLRDGSLRALATTNALELGIDISGLDAAVLTGWPGTHASFAQQTGRAGRAGRAGVAVYIPRDNPLDYYLFEHPEQLLAPSEANVWDPANPSVLTGHVCAAAAEAPLQAGDAQLFGLADTSTFERMEAAGLLKRRPAGWVWNTSLGHSAHGAVDVRQGGRTVAIVDSSSGAMLGTVDRGRADWEVFPGAIYVHQGVRYEVERLGESEALVHPYEGTPVMTFANDELSIDIEAVREERDMGMGSWCFGDVAVYSRVESYDIRRESDGMYLGTVGLDLPVHELHTQAVWYTLNEDACYGAGVEQGDLPGALHGAEHAAIGILPLLATCDRWDIGGLSTALHPGTGMPTVFVHDALAGGSGCARRGFEAGAAWMGAVRERLEACECEDGCPRCIQSPKCGNGNSPLSKAGATALVRLVAGALLG